MSLLDSHVGACHISGIKDRISQDPQRYLGDIYVTKLTPIGEPFRVDIAHNTPVSHTEVLSAVAGLAGDYGYPEELKLAHTTCVFSSIELLELQASASHLYGLTMRDELRNKIFPL